MQFVLYRMSQHVAVSLLGIFEPRSWRRLRTLKRDFQKLPRRANTGNGLSLPVLYKKLCHTRMSGNYLFDVRV